ncbi:phage virion morphogenesis protein [Methylobacterium hispanicum]|uniref:phage virion morphogenesis protein n=1 Tax=Methylobacterium hispanicum TaxID=270350 RepID=UPI002F339BC0
MTQIRVRVAGVEAAAARFDEIGSGAWKQGLLALVGGLVQRQTVTRIRSEKTSPDGAAWAAWARSTAARKKKGSGLLVDTGRLMGSISASVAGDTAVIGTNVFYGGYLQEGTSKMPARPFLGLSNANESELFGAAQAYVVSRLGL